MVYSNQFVLCILHKGQPQEELANKVVKLPFGSEYSIRLRNRNNRRACAKIFIDGENVSGNGYVVNANSHVDIKRHHDIDRSFRFVELDSPEAIDAGKSGPNEKKQKGVVEVRFYLEKECPIVPTVVHHHHPVVDHQVHHHHHYPKRWPWYDSTPRSPYTQPHVTWNSTLGGATNMAGESTGQTLSFGSNQPDLGAAELKANLRKDAVKRSRGPSGQSAGIQSTSKSVSESPPASLCGFDAAVQSFNALKDGCTVEGGQTGQFFSYENMELEDTYTSLSLFLQGYVEETVTTVAPQIRKTNKDVRLEDLESENEKLRRQLAELENQQLNAKLEGLKEKRPRPKKPSPKRKPRAKKS